MARHEFAQNLRRELRNANPSLLSLRLGRVLAEQAAGLGANHCSADPDERLHREASIRLFHSLESHVLEPDRNRFCRPLGGAESDEDVVRSEEQTSELQSI